jgi:alpha-L-fucosidase
MILIPLAAALLMTTSETFVAPPTPLEPLPHARQLAWKEMAFTGFIHFGPNTFTDKEWGHGDEPADVFNPSALDARQWVKTMKVAGIKGIVITAKHHDGLLVVTISKVPAAAESSQQAVPL